MVDSGVNLTGDIIPVILAGGIGSRLYPLSSPERPKQFLKLFDNSSLFAASCKRLVQNPLIVTNKSLQHIILKQCQQYNITPSNIIYEPEPKNTAPAILQACKNVKPNDVLVVMPSDHLIKNTDSFNKDLQKAIELANQGKIVTFGIKPTSANVNYGYISPTNPPKFTEKPDEFTAHKYIKQGYLFNSGIFVFKAQTMLDEAAKFCPNIMANIHNYNLLPSISIDYAIMEYTAKLATIKASFDWDDIGSWPSLIKNIDQHLYKTVIKPWGYYKDLFTEHGLKLKKIVVKPHSALSLQIHHKRAEHWVVLKGVANVQVNNKFTQLLPTQSIYIPLAAEHRLINYQEHELQIIEVQKGDYLAEDDIVRLEDNYGRAGILG